MIAGLLVGIGALAVPGIGPVLAFGPLAAAIGATAAGAGLGAAAGGIIGALVGLGIPEEDANFYAEGVKRGGVLVTVRADDARAVRGVDPDAAVAAVCRDAASNMPPRTASCRGLSITRNARLIRAADAHNCS